MKKKIPVAKPLSWPVFFIQITIMLVAVILIHLLSGSDNFAITAFIFMLILFLCTRITRGICLRAQKKAARHIRRGEFAEAIPYLEESRRFFNRYPWVDTLRHLILLTAWKFSYREAILLNLAFCHGQAGNGDLMKEYYQKAIAEFPDSQYAQMGLNLVLAAEKSARQPDPEDNKTVPEMKSESDSTCK